MHIIKFGTSPGDFIGPFAFRSDAEQYAFALSRGTNLPVEILPLRMPCYTIGGKGNALVEHLHKQVLADK